MTTSLSFLWGKGEMVRERLGEEYLLDFIPVARLLAAGLRVAAGSDWGPKSAFEQIALAVRPHFGASGRASPLPGITREAALAMWTREAAHVLRWDGIGSIEPGHLADLIVVDRDPLTTPVEELPSTRVLTTIVGGKTLDGDRWISPSEGLAQAFRRCAGGAHRVRSSAPHRRTTYLPTYQPTVCHTEDPRT